MFYYSSTLTQLADRARQGDPTAQRLFADRFGDGLLSLVAFYLRHPEVATRTGERIRAVAAQVRRYDPDLFADEDRFQARVARVYHEEQTAQLCRAAASPQWRKETVCA